MDTSLYSAIMKIIHKNIIFTITAITLFFIATTCDYDWDKDCKNMPKQGVETGEIINNAMLKISLPDDDVTTINLINYHFKEGHIVTSDSLNIFDLKVSFDNGANYHPIDFSKYAVLGKMEGGGCQVVFDRDVTKDVKNKKYIPFC